MNISLAVLFGAFAAIGWGVPPIYSKRAYSNGGSPITAGLVLSTIGSLFLFMIMIVIYSPEIFFKYGLNQVYPFIISGIISIDILRKSKTSVILSYSEYNLSYNTIYKRLIVKYIFKGLN